MMRYIRAFWQALQMTLRGETLESPQERRYPRLFDWLTQTRKQLAEVNRQAQQHNYDQAALTVHVDGRDMSMETILGGVRYHLYEEYPYLLANLTEHSITAIYASNLNDRYWVMTLAQVETLPPPLQDAVSALSTQLDAIPPSNKLES
jgi:hypothetical protein